MKISELLDVRSIELNVSLKDKESTIDKLVDLMDASGRLSDKQAYKEGVLKREELSTTGIGEGIAIPHAQVEAVKKAGLAAITIKDGVDYESLDGSKVNLAFMIAAPQDGGNTHLQALAKLSALLMNEKFREELLNAKDAKEFLSIIDKEEAIKDEEEKKKASLEKKQAKEGFDILAVTACPTGIAHTFMAAEALEKAAKDLNCTIKVETNGAEGTKNALTKEDISNCKGIIIAADKNVEMARFDGKPVISTTVSQGISKADALVKEIIDGKANTYHNEGNNEEVVEEDGGGIGHTIYKHLMNGVSYMLPFVIGGGILIALAFLFDDYSIDPSNFGKNTPLAAFLKTIGEQAFGMMLPVLAGYIAYSIADRPGLAVGFVGGLIAKMGMTFSNPAGGDVNSGFLGALLAGFIAGYLIIGLKKLCAKLPSALEGIKPVLIYPVVGILLIGVITAFINPAIGAINTWITGVLNGMGGTSKVLLGLVVGGMMSVDMGGPINKASYVFSTSQLASGNFEIMAACMVGGMVPPIAIALSTTFFKNRWTKEERNSGLVNYIMGLSFISEGAIPFAAKDPIRVIPACVVGSAVAGGLSMFFNCTLRAPHGGIFVVATIGNPLMYILALVIGSVVGALILSFLKKPIK
ncbi:MAG: fructose-specific PTS transporter subunit EIIC [Thomasclavelia sp.]|nr:fructose-specific PTS transporter subunit EIIC [Thomasclavelia sp.]